jgi:hypothetical protein
MQPAKPAPVQILKPASPPTSDLLPDATDSSKVTATGLGLSNMSPIPDPQATLPHQTPAEKTFKLPLASPLNGPNTLASIQPVSAASCIGDGTLDKQLDNGFDKQKVQAANAALTVGASKAEVVEKLLSSDPAGNRLQRAIRQFLPSWWLEPSPNETGAPLARPKHSPRRTPSADAKKVQAILASFKATRFTENPKVVPGMLDALRYFKDNNAHVVFCTNANALKVSQEWSSIVRSHWQSLTGIQISDERKLAHIYHQDKNPYDVPRSPEAQAADWDKIWNNLSDEIKTDRATDGFRIDIMGKCGKGKLPPDYPAVSPDVHLNPNNLAKLGITRADTLHFIGNEIKDAAAARYLADQGFNVQFYFLNHSELGDAIAYLEHHISNQANDHPDHDEHVQLLAHCKKWDLANWTAARCVKDGNALLQVIAPALLNTPQPKILMDFHGTISDQIQALTDLVKASTPPASPKRSDLNT